MRIIKIDPNAITNYGGRETDALDKNCASNLSYVPDTGVRNADPMVYIRVNIHFIHDSDTINNYYGTKGIQYAKELIFFGNDKLSKNQKMRLPKGNDTPVYDPGYRYVLMEDQIFFHQVEDEPFFINEGKRNNYSRKIIDRFAVNEDTVLNIFYMVHPPDSVRSKSYSASSAGIALGKSIKLGTKYNPDDKPWRHASLLNHEVGHVMGLSHTWRLNDGCDDTPNHPNCWHEQPSGKCKGPTSNNMMDYNADQIAITPCQIGKMRKNMMKLESRQRDLLVKNWCKLDTNKTVIIDRDTHFTGAKDLHGNLVVKKGAQLRISCRLSMPRDSRIEVGPGAELILDSARIHNDCGHQWNGIYVLEDKESRGQVYKIGEVSIENTKDPLPVAE